MELQQGECDMRRLEHDVSARAGLGMSIPCNQGVALA